MRGWSQTNPNPSKIIYPYCKWEWPSSEYVTEAYGLYQDYLRRQFVSAKRLLSGVASLLVVPVRQPRPISDFKAWRYKRGHYHTKPNQL